MAFPSTRRAASTVGTAVLVGAVLAACGSSGGSSGSASSNKDPIKVGVMVGQTGYLAAVDVPFSQGVKLAADDINKHGGVDGHKVQLTVLDMKSNAAEAVTVANQLLNQNQVGVILGGSTSAATAAAAPIAGRRSVPILAASVLPDDPTWTYSTLQPVTKSNAAGLGFAAKNLHATKIAVLFGETPYGQSAAEAMKEQAQSQGIQVTSSQGIQTGATDITTQLQQAKASGAQAILDVLTGPVHIVEAKDAAGMNLGLPLIMGTDTPPTFAQATAAYPQTYSTATAPQVYPQNTDPKIKAANKTFTSVMKANGKTTDDPGDVGRGWDTMHILAAGVHSSGAVTGEKLRGALEKVSYAGTSSEYEYTAKDHTGQKSVPNPLTVAQFKSDSVEVVYSA